jgi:hypothetical protein
MRAMEIPPFPRKFENPDLENLVRSRLSQTIVMWPDQAIALVGYMGWPNDPAARGLAMATLSDWLDGSKSVPPRLRRIQHEWLRVADVLHAYCDLVDGHHQARRGGPSIGKAITLVAAKAKSRGTGAANVWHLWKKYKDVAHLVSAAALISKDARNRYWERPFQPGGLSVYQFSPFQMAMMMPDLVLAVGFEFERRGLGEVRSARGEPAFDRETVWRIPTEISVMPFPHLIRKVSRQDLAVLGARRAGNRGRARKRETTPVSD